MLKLVIPGDEFWDEDAECFVYSEPFSLEFEHSLVSLSKWESKFHKLFLTPKQKTEEEMLGYVESMLLGDSDPALISKLSVEQFEKIDEYINDPMTGTTFAELPQNSPRSSEQISSELIYFWMSQYQIDIDAANWHLNRLFTLIRIHHAKSQKPQKMSRQKRVQTMAELNAQRRAKLGTSG